MFNAKQLPTVEANNPKVEWANFNKDSLIFDKAPMASIIPPNTMAQIISQMVGNIFAIPPEVNKSVKVLFSVGTITSVVIACITPLYADLNVISEAPVI